MTILVSRRQHYSTNAIFFENAFPTSLLKYALTVLDTHYPVSGFVGDGTKGGVRIVDPNLRQSEVRFIHLKKETRLIFDWISDFGNEHRWYFSGETGRMPSLKTKAMRRLSPEPIQITTYKQNNFYDWHIDGREGDKRRLTLISPLTYSKDYVGGELQFKDEDVPPWALDVGSVILVRPELQHRVTPVTQGVRNSLITWFR